MILTEDQKRAIDMPFKGGVSILTGLPGSGKSTVVKDILDKADSKGFLTKLAAPTGRAAKRLMETTGRYASTIHSLLMPIFNGAGFSFGFNEDCPVDADLIIIDEVSMIDNNLMYSLLLAIDSTKTRLLMVGDNNQLPSVGPGNILADMINSSVFSRVHLSTIHRNSGAIVEACSMIYQGRPYTKHKKIDLEAKNPVNFIHIDAETPEKIKNTIVKLGSELLPDRCGFDPVSDIQVISPVNVKGEMSCEKINKDIRVKINKNADPDKVMSIGDKVINTKNQKMIDTNKKEQVVVNGDIGIIKEDNGSQFIVNFFDPDRSVYVKKSNNDLLLAYCITCHRFQGSESPVIIFPIHSSFTYFANRNWLYTAISRGKLLVITVGDLGASRRMIGNTSGNDRVTFLKTMVQNITTKNSGDFITGELDI